MKAKDISNVALGDSMGIEKEYLVLEIIDNGTGGKKEKFKG